MISDYAFVHDGRVYTPNHMPVATVEVEAHSASLERAELDRWAQRPPYMLAYYGFPVERPTPYRSTFSILAEMNRNWSQDHDPHRPCPSCLDRGQRCDAGL